jgi:hypothetical protein
MAEYYELYLKYHDKNINKNKNTNLLPYYYCVSSHNTYLPGNQLTSKSTYYIYMAILNKFGGGCLEIDPICLTSDQKDIKIYHLKTPTGEIKLGILLKLIILWLRDPTNEKKGPIILTFDNKTLKYKFEHDIIWKIFNDILYNDKNKDLVVWYTENINNTPIEELVGKIIIRWDQCTHNQNKVESNSNDIKLNDECKILKNDKLEDSKGIFFNCNNKACPKKWINITKPNNSLLKYYNYIHKDIQMQTIKQDDNLIKSGEINTTLISNLTIDLLRVYPDPLKIKSGNYNPEKFITNGIQYVALNFQIYGIYLSMYYTFFDNETLIHKLHWMLTRNYNKIINPENYLKIYPPYYLAKINIISCIQQTSNKTLFMSNYTDLYDICIYDALNNKPIPIINGKVELLTNISFPVFGFILKKKTLLDIHKCDNNNSNNYYGSVRYNIPVDIIDNFIDKTKINILSLNLCKTENIYMCDNKKIKPSEISKCNFEIPEDSTYNDDKNINLFYINKMKHADLDIFKNMDDIFMIEITYELEKTSYYPDAI